MTERATHEVVARQLRELADQVEAGSLELDTEGWSPPTVIEDPVDVDVDLLQKRHQVVLTIHLRWGVS
mgnify:CR=1 FL=1